MKEKMGFPSYKWTDDLPTVNKGFGNPQRITIKDRDFLCEVMMMLGRLYTFLLGFGKTLGAYIC